MIKNKKVLIVGGTGALGKTLVERYHGNNDVIVLSRDEHKHYFLKKDYPNISSVIGDVKDKNSIKNCLLRFKPEIVINAAALKHVPICEDDPFESVKTNIIGHQNIIESVTEVGDIETLMFVSTDKACNPINVYGMCKSISEKLYIEYAKQRDVPKVVLVRYGNVLESTGSVIPFFKSLLESGSDYLPITHKDMTRFLLTLNQATELIDWAYHSENSHGKIAVPKIKALKVTDVADVLKKSYEVDIPLKYIGIRRGEKLHEEMISKEEWMRTEEHDNFLIGNEYLRDEQKSFNSFDSLMDSSEAFDFLRENGVVS
jgi:UDP-N-acetylglucosamine 4,6-dehydratase/5-epimerase